MPCNTEGVLQRPAFVCELSRSERSVTMRSVRIESGSGYETAANFIKLTRQVS